MFYEMIILMKRNNFCLKIFFCISYSLRIFLIMSKNSQIFKNWFYLKMISSTKRNYIIYTYINVTYIFLTFHNFFNFRVGDLFLLVVIKIHRISIVYNKIENDIVFRMYFNHNLIITINIVMYIQIRLLKIIIEN